MGSTWRPAPRAAYRRRECQCRLARDSVLAGCSRAARHLRTNCNDRHHDYARPGRALIDKLRAWKPRTYLTRACRGTVGTAQILPSLPLQAARRSALLLRIFENPAPATIISFAAVFSSSASDASGTMASTDAPSSGRPERDRLAYDLPYRLSACYRVARGARRQVANEPQ